jgi:hypothetical protein
LKEVDNIESVPNWISYHYENSGIFNPFLAILINFLNSKRDLEFPKFQLKIHIESEEFCMEKVVPLFKHFMPIFYFKNFER